MCHKPIPSLCVIEILCEYQILTPVYYYNFEIPRFVVS